MERKNISSDFPNTELLYIDSHIMVECGLFYIAMAEGRITTTEQELLDLNKIWGEKIKSAMGYTEFYSTVELVDSLRLLCTEGENQKFTLTNDGISSVLGKVQRYSHSKMNISSFMVVLDHMIKDHLNSMSKNEREEQLNGLKKQLSEHFMLEPTVSFNTNEDQGKLAILLLGAVAEIYHEKSYENAMTDKELGGFIHLINERERKFHTLIKNITEITPEESQKFLIVAKQIREDKIVAYKKICERTIRDLTNAPIKEVTE